mmetsp:Transcript_15059/g.35449  ORF Transcript_15059/g.35449 Transcript_15059/m.35449 type:complete len:847 (+) Transcript_15059:220-2760(+)
MLMARTGPRTFTRVHRYFSAYATKRSEKASEIAELPEIRQSLLFGQQLRSGSLEPYRPSGGGKALLSVATREEVLSSLQAGFVTFALASEARVASALGEGLYTIGPCGEELLAAVGTVLRADDSVALHYRHLATQLARHARPLEEQSGVQDPDILKSTNILWPLFLDRARGHVVSSFDPVTGGAHCALGGGPQDFVVTSTLASQATPAVGRALAPSLERVLGLSQDSRLQEDRLSYVSLGDGSVNNAHFLSAVNISKYAAYRGWPCPVLFAVSNNDLCISLKGRGWLAHLVRDLGLQTFECDGWDLGSILEASRTACRTVRATRRPGLLLVSNLPRRFGHAATDRQGAYLSEAEVARQEAANPLAAACAQAVSEGVCSWSDLSVAWEEVCHLSQAAFAQASEEPKLESLGIANLEARNRAPLPADLLFKARAGVVPSSLTPFAALAPHSGAENDDDKKKQGKGAVMRKHMTRCIAETLEAEPRLVYLGEDVEHGGYYLITEGLAKAFPGRVRDMPPDETSLLGIGHGLAQSGFFVVVEIPYAKYLDCGADMFQEIAIAHWLQSSEVRGAGFKRRPAGMVIRLQGFDRGVFGGNFHTHNSLPLPPGVDVVVASNGADWVRSWRHAVRAAKAGRVVMVVDSTDLLNRRHVDVDDRDGLLQTAYPEAREILGFEALLRHDHGFKRRGMPPGTEAQTGTGADSLACSGGSGSGSEIDGGEWDDVTVVTYGTGVVSARQTQKVLGLRDGLSVGILEVPCISGPHPPALTRALSRSATALFADPCKSGSAPLLNFIATLKKSGAIGRSRDWAFVAAEDTYNPLGSTLTFLGACDVERAALELVNGPGQGGSN